MRAPAIVTDEGVWSPSGCIWRKLGRTNGSSHIEVLLELSGVSRRLGLGGVAGSAHSVPPGVLAQVAVVYPEWSWVSVLVQSDCSVESR